MSLYKTSPHITLSETKYKTVATGDIDDTGGKVPASGQKVSVYRFRANGSDPQAYVRLVWDHGGGEETVFASTRGDIDIIFNTDLAENHVTGDGTKKFLIVIENDNASTSPIIGGEYEIVDVT